MRTHHGPWPAAVRWIVLATGCGLGSPLLAQAEDETPAIGWSTKLTSPTEALADRRFTHRGVLVRHPAACEPFVAQFKVAIDATFDELSRWGFPEPKGVTFHLFSSEAESKEVIGVGAIGGKWVSGGTPGVALTLPSTLGAVAEQFAKGLSSIAIYQSQGGTELTVPNWILLGMNQQCRIVVYRRLEGVGEPFRSPIVKRIVMGAWDAHDRPDRPAMLDVLTDKQKTTPDPGLTLTNPATDALLPLLGLATAEEPAGKGRQKQLAAALSALVKAETSSAESPPVDIRMAAQSIAKAMELDKWFRGIAADAEAKRRLLEFGLDVDGKEFQRVLKDTKPALPKDAKARSVGTAEDLDGKRRLGGAHVALLEVYFLHTLQEARQAVRETSK